MIDKVFDKPIEKKFEFDESVATVFDDMISRSVPYYETVQNLMVDLILSSAKEETKILDLGSSTGKFLLDIARKSTLKMKFVGMDNSIAMLKIANQKAMAYGADIEFRYGDILLDRFEDSNIIIANYTLQFIRPLQRVALVQKIYDALPQDGVFYFCEKVVFEDKKLDKELIDIYYKYKKSQGYSEYEIAQKREALENVLIPFTIKENRDMCLKVGFKSVETLFQWANFVTFVAKKYK